MSCSRLFILLSVLISQVCMAPQEFISFKDGKLGLNIAGFHAGIGIGGSVDGSGTSGGLFAEAGTPFGQTAKAGIGAAVDTIGGVSGQLFADAMGGDNLKVSAGVGGKVSGDKTAGAIFATAQSSDRLAYTKMTGERTVSGAEDRENEVKPLGVAKVDREQEEQVTETHIVDSDTHNKRRHHNLGKTAFLGGHIGPGGEIIPPAVESKQVSQRSVDVDAEASINSETNVSDDVSHTTFTKTVTYQKNPTFFSDIFNIPISALKAVGSLLGNTVANTNINVQKSATIETAESDSISAKHHPSSLSSSNAHISVETPSATQLIDDILAIPINTLGAVNKFLENNVAGRKNIQIRREGGEPTRVRLGPHARRRAHKQVVVVQEAEKEAESS